MNIQWYPGHMTKTRRMIAEQIKNVDAVCEILDARIPMSSRNPDVDELTAGKPRLVVLNRVDQADPELTKKWDDVEAELQRVVDNVCHYLDGTDEKALRQASYENKARLLLMITENYQRSIADEIRVAADKIQLELLPKMKEYQEQAKR